MMNKKITSIIMIPKYGSSGSLSVNFVLFLDLLKKNSEF